MTNLSAPSSARAFCDFSRRLSLGNPILQSYAAPAELAPTPTGTGMARSPASSSRANEMIIQRPRVMQAA